MAKDAADEQEADCTLLGQVVMVSVPSSLSPFFVFSVLLSSVGARVGLAVSTRGLWALPPTHSVSERVTPYEPDPF